MRGEAASEVEAESVTRKSRQRVRKTEELPTGSHGVSEGPNEAGTSPIGQKFNAMSGQPDMTQVTQMLSQDTQRNASKGQMPVPSHIREQIQEAFATSSTQASSHGGNPAIENAIMALIMHRLNSVGGAGSSPGAANVMALMNQMNEQNGMNMGSQFGEMGSLGGSSMASFMGSNTGMSSDTSGMMGGTTARTGNTMSRDTPFSASSSTSTFSDTVKSTGSPSFRENNPRSFQTAIDTGPGVYDASVSTSGSVTESSFVANDWQSARQSLPNADFSGVNNLADTKMTSVESNTSGRSMNVYSGVTTETPAFNGDRLKTSASVTPGDKILYDQGTKVSTATAHIVHDNTVDQSRVNEGNFGMSVTVSERVQDSRTSDVQQNVVPVPGTFTSVTVGLGKATSAVENANVGREGGNLVTSDLIGQASKASETVTLTNKSPTGQAPLINGKSLQIEKTVHGIGTRTNTVSRQSDTKIIKTQNAPDHANIGIGASQVENTRLDPSIKNDVPNFIKERLKLPSKSVTVEKTIDASVLVDSSSAEHSIFAENSNINTNALSVTKTSTFGVSNNDIPVAVSNTLKMHGTTDNTDQMQKVVNANKQTDKDTRILIVESQGNTNPSSRNGMIKMQELQTGPIPNEKSVEFFASGTLDSTTQAAPLPPEIKPVESTSAFQAVKVDTNNKNPQTIVIAPLNSTTFDSSSTLINNNVHPSAPLIVPPINDISQNTQRVVKIDNGLNTVTTESSWETVVSKASEAQTADILQTVVSPEIGGNIQRIETIHISSVRNGISPAELNTVSDVSVSDSAVKPSTFNTLTSEVHGTSIIETSRKSRTEIHSSENPPVIMSKTVDQVPILGAEPGRYIPISDSASQTNDQTMTNKGQAITRGIYPEKTELSGPLADKIARALAGGKKNERVFEPKSLDGSSTTSRPRIGKPLGHTNTFTSTSSVASHPIQDTVNMVETADTRVLGENVQNPGLQGSPGTGHGMEINTMTDITPESSTFDVIHTSALNNGKKQNIFLLAQKDITQSNMFTSEAVSGGTEVANTNTDNLDLGSSNVTAEVISTNQEPPPNITIEAVNFETSNTGTVLNTEAKAKQHVDAGLTDSNLQGNVLASVSHTVSSTNAATDPSSTDSLTIQMLNNKDTEQIVSETSNSALLADVKKVSNGQRQTDSTQRIGLPDAAITIQNGQLLGKTVNMDRGTSVGQNTIDLEITVDKIVPPNMLSQVTEKISADTSKGRNLDGAEASTATISNTFQSTFTNEAKVLSTQNQDKISFTNDNIRPATVMPANSARTTLGGSVVNFSNGGVTKKRQPWKQKAFMAADITSLPAGTDTFNSLTMKRTEKINRSAGANDLSQPNNQRVRSGIDLIGSSRVSKDVTATNELQGKTVELGLSSRRPGMQNTRNNRIRLQS